MSSLLSLSCQKPFLETSILKIVTLYVIYSFNFNLIGSWKKKTLKYLHLSLFDQEFYSIILLSLIYFSVSAFEIWAFKKKENYYFYSQNCTLGTLLNITHFGLTNGWIGEHTTNEYWPDYKIWDPDIEMSIGLTLLDKAIIFILLIISQFLSLYIRNNIQQASISASQHFYN